jgi:fibronectin type 3 domain-containing protein
MDVHCRGIRLLAIVLLLAGMASAEQASKPFALTITNHQTTLAWIASPSAVAGYYVYRSDSQGGPYSRISDPVVDLGFVDHNVVAGNTYFYVVTAYTVVYPLLTDGTTGTAEVESSYSNETAATIPTP